MPAHNDYLRVVQVRRNGVLVLQGRDGGVLKDTGSMWAPYHGNVDGAICPDAVADRLLRNVDDGLTTCWLCDDATSDQDAYGTREAMLLCDLCNQGFHLGCVGLAEVPAGSWICPTCVQFGQPAVVAGAAVLSCAVGSLAFDAACFSHVRSAAELGELMNMLMPGRRSPSYLQRLFKRLPGGASFLQPDSGLPECVITRPAEISALLRCLNLRAVPAVLDCWAGTGTIASVCTGAGVPLVLQADIHPRSQDVFWANALRLDHLQGLALQLPPGFVVMTSPWFVWNDVAIPLLLRCGAAAVFVHVSSTYITDATRPRARWLHAFGTRLHVVVTAERGDVGRNAVWLCFFAGDDTRARLLTSTPSGVTVAWAAFSVDAAGGCGGAGATYHTLAAG